LPRRSGARPAPPLPGERRWGRSRAGPARRREPGRRSSPPRADSSRPPPCRSRGAP